MSVISESEWCEFGPVTVHFDRHVLAPRPWTLLQSTWAAELAHTAAPGRILELFAGAGHIGLAAAVLSGRALVQVEANPVAAEFAVANAAHAGRGEHVEVRHAPIATALKADERFPIVVADPPYLPTGEVHRWPADPIWAIDGGTDGTALIRATLNIASSHLSDGGVFLLQVAGDAQAELVINLAETKDSGLTHQDTRRHDAERAVMLFSRTIDPAGDSTTLRDTHRR